MQFFSEKQILPDGISLRYFSEKLRMLVTLKEILLKSDFKRGL